MSAEDRLKKVAEEQALHIASLKEKLDSIDSLSSKLLAWWLELFVNWVGYAYHNLKKISLIYFWIKPYLLTLIEEQVYADPIKKLQEEFYQQLVILREGLAQTVEVACVTASGPVQPLPALQVSSAESCDATAAEMAKLKEENNKLKYRMKMLLKSLEEVEAKQKKWTASGEEVQNRYNEWCYFKKLIMQMSEIEVSS